MQRREFIGVLGAAAAWPLTARAQQPAMPVIGFLSGRSLASDAHLVAAFGQGLNETGYVVDRDVKIEFHWAEGQFDRLRVMAADLVNRQVATILREAGTPTYVASGPSSRRLQPCLRRVAIQSGSASLQASIGRAATPQL